MAAVSALRVLARRVLVLGWGTLADGPLAVLPLGLPLGLPLPLPLTLFLPLGLPLARALSLGLTLPYGVPPLPARLRQHRRRRRLVLLLVTGVPRAR